MRTLARTLGCVVLLAGLGACAGGAPDDGSDDETTVGATPTLGEAREEATIPTGGTSSGSLVEPVSGPAEQGPSGETGGTADATTTEGAIGARDVAGNVATPPAASLPIDGDDTGNGSGEATPSTGTSASPVDETFAVALTSVDVRRRSTGERVPIDVVGIASGELRVTLSSSD